ncbi:MAG: peptidoglycan hydrolase FlgJ [Tepidanaerobacteraceae bacterium]|nr:peptidoglycan hydrolase FlgJ [Tepidanaerobacteraceae bacterium]
MVSMVEISSAAYPVAQALSEKVSYTLGKTENSAETREKEKLKKVCEDFESIFVYYILQKMRDTVPKEGFFEQGVSYDIIQSMHDEALAEELSKGGGLGLAAQIYNQLSKYV